MKKFKPVKFGMIQANVYQLDTCESCPVEVDSAMKYESLVRTQTDCGYEERVEEFDYPITPESVNSYLDSCDYKSDPLGNLARSSARQNLGDVSDIQNIASMDMDTARAMYRELLAKLSTAEKNKVSSSVEMKDKNEKEGEK